MAFCFKISEWLNSIRTKKGFNHYATLYRDSIFIREIRK